MRKIRWCLEFLKHSVPRCSGDEFYRNCFSDLFFSPLYCLHPFLSLSSLSLARAGGGKTRWKMKVQWPLQALRNVRRTWSQKLVASDWGGRWCGTIHPLKEHGYDDETSDTFLIGMSCTRGEMNEQWYHRLKGEVIVADNFGGHVSFTCNVLCGREGELILIQKSKYFERESNLTISVSLAMIKFAFFALLLI